MTAAALTPPRHSPRSPSLNYIHRHVFSEDNVGGSVHVKNEAAMVSPSQQIIRLARRD